MGAWNPSEGLSVGALVFAGPTVNVCGLHRIPFSGALRVFEHRTADAVFPLLGGMNIMPAQDTSCLPASAIS